jgi:hypothetical protein
MPPLVKNLNENQKIHSEDSWYRTRLFEECQSQSLCPPQFLCTLVIRDNDVPFYHVVIKNSRHLTTGKPFADVGYTRLQAEDRVCKQVLQSINCFD